MLPDIPGSFDDQAGVAGIIVQAGILTWKTAGTREECEGEDDIKNERSQCQQSLNATPVTYSSPRNSCYIRCLITPYLMSQTLTSRQGDV